MPNIEIHGFDLPEAKVMYQQICELVSKNAPDLINDAVVTIYNDQCLNLKGEKQPFIRIVSSNPLHYDELEMALAELGVDMELALLDRFVPGKQTKSGP